MMRGNCLRGLLALLATAAACDVNYIFPENSTGVTLTKMEVTLTWWTIQPVSKANVYLSNAAGTGCNSGYFGAQFHSDGTQMLLFSMWDAPKYNKSSEWTSQGVPASPNCRRNALDATGKSTGVQCAIPHPTNTSGPNNITLEFGIPYRFALGMVEQNESGALWEVTMWDPARKLSISVGKMFFVDAPMGLDPSKCRGLGKSQIPPVLGPAAYTFMEYYAQPWDYVSAATWSDMVTSGPDGAVFRAEDIASDCCFHDVTHNETSLKCVPPECDRLELRFEGGPFLPVRHSALQANPTCFHPKPVGFKRPLLEDCWQGGAPSSLDECFGRQLPDKRSPSTPAIVV
jgi:hypothetical protein